MTRGKNKRLRLIPSHLPLIRDKLADFAQYRLRKLGSQTQYEAMMANAWSMTDQIRTAQLWWVSRDMTRLAEDTVQAGDFPEPDPPAQCGMIFFEGDVQHISFHLDNDGFGETRVAAILWQDAGRESVKISVFTDNPVGIKEMHADSFGLPIVSLAQVRGVQMVRCDYLLVHQSQPPPTNCQQSESASISMIRKSGNFSRVSLFTRVSACSRVV